MNKILMMVFISAGVCVSIEPVSAAQKCVPLNSSTTCTGQISNNTSYWVANCSTGGTDVFVRGRCGCSSQNGDGIGAKSDSITTSRTAEENMYCWCKMTTPAISSWVFTGFSGTAGSCATSCARVCASNISTYANFRSAMFSGLND